jgi:hypothetical protein
MEIMTGRHDLPSMLMKRLVDAPSVFGDFATGGPAIELDSVHHLAKTVDGAPLRRPWWFFDVRAQGRGPVDIPTHLVDKTQWLLDARTAPDTPIHLLAARAWPTLVPLEAFTRITGEPGVPEALRPCVEGDALRYVCNAALDYRIGDVTARATTRWDLAPPDGGGDTSRAVARGTRAEVRLEQGRHTGHRRQLVVDARGEDGARALAAAVASWQSELPGVRVEPAGPGCHEVVVPPALDGGHETHFARVLADCLRAIDARDWPAALAARTLAKYTLLAEAAAATA